MIEYVSIKVPKVVKVSAELIRAEIIGGIALRSLEGYLKFMSVMQS